MIRSVIRPVAPFFLMLGLAPGVAQAAPAPRSLVVVGAQPGALAAARQAVVAVGGTPGRSLGIVDGFTAHVPAGAIAGLRHAPGILMVAEDQPLRLSADEDVMAADGSADATPPADAATATDTTADASASSLLDLVPTLLDPATGLLQSIIAPPPATIPAGPVDQVADTVVGEAAVDAAAGEDESPVLVPRTEGLAATTAPAADDGNARALASMDAVRGGAGATGTLTGQGVDVALIDSGVVGLPALAADGQLVRGPDYSEDAATSDLRGLDAFGHGTHMAGIIAGDDPATGFKGVAPRARLVSVKVAGADGITSLVRVLMAMDWVRDHHDAGGLHVLGVDQVRPYTREPLAYAVERLWAAGVTVVAAAGNEADGTGHLDLPAADPFVLAVGATDPAGTADPSDDAVADYSSGDTTRNPDVVAPGSSVISLRVPGSTLDEEFPAARIGDQYFRGSGTSMATAVVTGVVARLYQAHPTATPNQIKALLKGSAVLVAGSDAAHEGAGRVDARTAATLAVPSVTAAAQPFAPARLDLLALWSDLAAEAAGTAPEVGTGENGWTGRRWSGRRWSGRRWSGRRWSGGSYGD
jgi:serine protease AprX